MYKTINSSITIATRRNKTESKYLEIFLNWWEEIAGKPEKPENLFQVLDLIITNWSLKKFEINFRISGKYVSGSVATIEMNISNRRFKLPVVLIYHNYKSGELNQQDAEIYMNSLEQIINQN